MNMVSNLWSIVYWQSTFSMDGGKTRLGLIYRLEKGWHWIVLCLGPIVKWKSKVIINFTISQTIIKFYRLYTYSSFTWQKTCRIVCNSKDVASNLRKWCDMDSYYTRDHNLKYQFNTLPTHYIILTIHSYKDESSTTRIHKAYLYGLEWLSTRYLIKIQNCGHLILITFCVMM